MHRMPIQDGYLPGDKFLDYYVPALLDTGLYYEDGQIHQEVYEYGSFLQSLMYRKNVRCTDCHDPHTTRIRAQGNAPAFAVTRRESTTCRRTTIIYQVAKGAQRAMSYADAKVYGRRSATRS